MDWGINRVMDDTSFIFKMSSGGRDDRMCSKISGGSSDTEMGRVSDSTRGNMDVDESHHEGNL